MAFSDRREAGGRLAERLGHLRGEDVVVLGVPHGGTPVADEVARRIGGVPCAVPVVRIVSPRPPWATLGAVGESGVRVLDGDAIRQAGLDAGQLAAAERVARAELARLREVLRGISSPRDLHGRTAVVVDDGIASGVTARAACQVARARGADRLVFATPVCAPAAAARVAELAEELVYLQAPRWFAEVGQHYRDFRAVTDNELAGFLRRPAVRANGVAGERTRTGPLGLPGVLQVPGQPRGLVVLAHASASARPGAWPGHVAGRLNQHRFATLSVDLLTGQNDARQVGAADSHVLALRLAGVLHRLREHEATRGLATGLLGIGLGTAVVLRTAAERGTAVRAIVVGGGRPDLRLSVLDRVQSATLFLVPCLDERGLDRAVRARERIRGESRAELVPDADHDFTTATARGWLARLACSWFSAQLVSGSRALVRPRPPQQAG
ncbi:putative phosphoribosyl transferase [Crossiella equi]|uniref:Phosphoribosyl transferase n=1 Tax=Crossiella equi TaxID=130796 RepID=A0ABS5A642_9PSEU|nr:phosphoribosyltransferase family protein [Crossiella equi]MBP2472078.1 putative phosphoribosyl transferase [Crossiella equi]